MEEGNAMVTRSGLVRNVVCHHCKESAWRFDCGRCGYHGCADTLDEAMDLVPPHVEACAGEMQAIQSWCVI